MRTLHLNTKLPPGPKDNILGARVMAEFKSDPLAFLLKMAHTYGDILQWPFGPFRSWMAAHPDYVYQVLTTDADKFYKATVTKRSLGPTIGNGLLLSDGEFWRRQRKLIQPAFHARRLQGYGKGMTDNTDRLLAEWQPGQTRDLHHDMILVERFIDVGDLSLTERVVQRIINGDHIDPQPCGGRPICSRG